MKPTYTRSDLDRITNEDLLNRIELIDNALAREISIKLHRAMKSAVPLSSRYDNHYFIRNGETRIITSPVLPISKTNVFFLGSLIQMLNRMSRISFSDLIADGPDALKERMSNAGFYGRFDSQLQNTSSTDDIGGFLISHLEYIVNPQAKLSWKSLRIILYIAYFLSMMAVSVFAIRIGSTINVGIWAFLLLSAVSVPIAFMFGCIRNHESIRILALYISFTDEFIDNDRQYEDPAVEEAENLAAQGDGDAG
ncbi:hypothetical protein KDL29_13795 [bacterium]|nr:hypothetical protein [bacterium]